MADTQTKLTDLINPEVMADMISAKIPNKIVVTPFAAIDNTLEGQPGNTITVPRYAYIGDAEDVAEGVAAGTAKLQTGTTKATVKKAVKAVELTDEALLSGYGDPETEVVNQIAKAIASKLDADAMAAITGSDVQLKFDGSGKVISYAQIVDAIDVFGEEMNTEKVIFVNPAQVSTLRKDPDFISADKYGQGTNVMLTGEIGRIANCRVVPSKKVEKAAAGTYACPIVKLQNDDETEDDAAAITVYTKRGVNLETDRNVLSKTTVYSADEHYTVALSNTAKVVLATFKA